MKAEVVDSGRKLSTVSQRMAIVFIIMYAISDFDILQVLSNDKNESQGNRW